MCHRSMDIEVRAVNTDERSVDIIASTTAIDSHGDILLQDWNLKRFRKNPVVLWHHNIFESSRWSMGEGIRPEDLLPIGRATNVRVEDNKLQMTLVFGSAEFNHMSEKVFLGFKEGIIKATSVGFRPGVITEEKLQDGSKQFTLSKNDLMEVSVVPIPSNPESVAKSAAYERTHFGRLAAKETETMTDQEKQALADAQKLAKEAGERATAAETRADTAETDLKAEKAASAQLKVDLEKATAERKVAEAKTIEQTIDGYVGKKLTPAERDDQVKLATDIGLDRVKGMLDLRADISLTTPVLDADGNEIRSTQQPAPRPTDGSGTSGSADIAAAAVAEAHK